MTTVLSIDGGGIRGLIPAMVLAEIEERSGRPIADLFDVGAGVSTGGILVSGLAIPDGSGGPKYTAAEVAGIYGSDRDEIFDQPFFREVIPLGLDDYFDAEYPKEGLKDVLRERMGATRLSEGLMELVVPTYDVGNREPFVWRSSRAEEVGEGDWPDRPLWEVSASTSVAPTYFEPFQVTEPTGLDRALVDAGIYGFSPVFEGLRTGTGAAAESGAATFEDVTVVSLGTGRGTESFTYEEVEDWGKAGWAKPVVWCGLDGSAESANDLADDFVPDGQFWRLQVDLANASDAMDDVSDENMEALRRDADRLIDQHDEAIDDMVETLT